MAYRNPAFLLNKLPAFGAAAISVSAALVATKPKERLIDGRISRNAARSGAGALEIFFDLSAAITCDALVIPPGHNLNGAAVEVKTYPSGAHSGGTVRSSGTVGSAAAIERTFGSVSSQWWSVNITSTGSAWELPEVILGEKKTTASGIVPPWEARFIEAVNVTELATREASVRRGAPRRAFTLEHRWLSVADLAIYDAVIAAGRAEPFWHWPVDDAIAGLLVKLSDEPERTQDSPNPSATGPRYRVRLELNEQAT